MLRKSQERTFVPDTLRGKSKQSNGNTSDVPEKGSSAYRKRIFQLTLGHLRSPFDAAVLRPGTRLFAGVSIGLACSSDRCPMAASCVLAGLRPAMAFVLSRFP